MALAKYTRLSNLTQYALLNPTAQYNPSNHDAEFNSLVSITGLAIDLLNKVTRSDGRLANNSVGVDTITDDLYAAIVAIRTSTSQYTGAWQAGFFYKKWDLVVDGSQSYLCLQDHTSVNLVTDTQAFRWAPIGVALAGITTLATLAVTGALTGTTAAFSGLLTAASAQIAGALQAATAAFTGAISSSGYTGTTASFTGTVGFGGNVSLTGSNGQRITGDFSNATLANRTMFQTTTVDANSLIGVIPNGTATQSSLQLFNAANPTNASVLHVYVTSAVAGIASQAVGSGTNLPMAFFTGGAERMRIDTAGNVGIGVTPTVNRGILQVQRGVAGGIPAATGSADANQIATIGSAGNTLRIGLLSGGDFWFQGSVLTDYSSPTSLRFCHNGGDMTYNGASGGLGYGVGAGGSVTQLTSKATAVTLNRPSGRITLNAASLAANTSVAFTVNNSTIDATDIIVLNVVSGAAAQTSYLLNVAAVSAGSFVVHLRNTTAAALAEAVVIGYAVIKGSVT